jgi:soluble lytic murein transglycosylase
MSRIFPLTVLALLLVGVPAQAGSPAAQRQVFLQALPHAEAGRWQEVEPLLGALEGYPLLPDLRAAWFRSEMGRADDDELARFLERHAQLGFSANLRRQWAGSLARRGEWKRFLELYEARYAGTGDTALHCDAHLARIRLGRTEGLEQRVLETWLVPFSLPAECDAAFEWLKERGAITAEARRQRMTMALESGQFSLARWLARPLGEAELAEVARWERMHANPKARTGALADWHDTPEDRALLHYGFLRLASSEPEVAAERWPAFRQRFAFSAGQREAVERRISLMHAWRHLPGSRALLATLPQSAQDEETRAWAVRAALRSQDWDDADRLLAQLDDQTAQQPAWRYWRARVLEALGRGEQAHPVYAELAKERGYYSFLSADRLEADYNWQHTQTAANDDVLAALEQRHDIARARELYFTGLEASGRIEWQQAMVRLSAPERAQASLLASRWGWHSGSITAATGGEIPDDLELRFPLPWRPVFEARSRKAGIDSAWAYGVARSESLFMPDVSSGAGAVGLMQLMPGTGRQTAQRAGIAYQGHRTLLDPDTNVALGTTYLAKMLERYGNHRVLATAAYNAGPARVDRWLPSLEAVPADAWVESVPFGETRGYVQRVLASEAVFRWRMSGETVRLSEAMQPVPPKQGP